MRPPSPPDTGSDLPPHHVCEQARLSRDARFDGLFFTVVSSTRIYCRPMCPAPAPKPRNVGYMRSAAAAEAAGYRPCLRCRPELSPHDGAWRRGDAAVARALKLIDAGALADGSLDALAACVGIGARQLRRVFVDRVGATPHQVHDTRRLLFAKQLLTETRLPITDVALASGFTSLRRFNARLKDAYRMAPRDLRRGHADRTTRVAATAGHGDAPAPLVLRLAYRPPYDLDWMLGFLRGHALPGVEHVDGSSYARTIGGRTPDGAAGWLRVSAWPGDAHALRLELHAADLSRLTDTVQRVRRMFDLDADPRGIVTALAADPRLAPLVGRHPGLRLPCGWDGFEIAVRAVLGQQVSIAAARTFAERAALLVGATLPSNTAMPTLTHVFPTPAALADADLSVIGVTGARTATLRTVARAVRDGAVDFRVDRTLDDHIARWTALPGIGPWTAHYIVLRALGHPDTFPADDLVLQKSLPDDGTRMTAKALDARAVAWRPWRAYATLHLWRDAMAKPSLMARRGVATADGATASMSNAKATAKAKAVPHAPRARAAETKGDTR